ncbi:tRNA-specific adenosine deaminase [Thiomicrorhabdus immobilis]|uniref:tRNA-specific adenosine deaminase n=1 Tax=Thiomicrorhabdus immobilis TaxID=2791037 RepID=A0ABN6CY90_9GAMM|nr:tRNA adenosine(34) deaminase TadA [Thiomicrorhabdus immobilis]BCN92897.1 tRNA-specific adenosine deaminase [Thiomicrorhabdus immobilis]
MVSKIECPEGINQQQQDEFWMEYAQQCARKAEDMGEVPVGAVVVLDNRLIAEGWNQSITNHDPTAHAEVIALKEAGKAVGNYRLVDATLYVTLEPCAMCAGAMVHARVKRVVFGAYDAKTGAAGSVFNIVDAPQLNHQLLITGGIRKLECAEQVSQFFQKRRKAHKLKKRKANEIS